ncbi:hypothetical protein EVJ20_07085 [Exiguobacterium sp. SH0S1]|uniref:hypothetical protein n=1 Tax=Exiguobacterium sp. SH0S1 TaxID=2510949 RepID=UPI001038EDCF|nr:hypothetical protein [Exiguobacterium sp. SH0S1]TCI77719.1 hypothetical protein EVJ20_07085 [Exiguobacterium sp. SH0S1]
MNSGWETIISLGGEGGSLCLAGRRLDAQTWEYVMVSDESTLSDTFHDEQLEAIRRSNIVSRWSEAIELLGRYWMRLSPRYVHPEFKERFLDEIEKSGVRNVSHRWIKIFSSSE